MALTLSDLLAAHGYREAAFAREIGIPATTLYSIVGGKTNVANTGVGTFVKIAHGLGLGTEELFYLLTDNDAAENVDPDPATDQPASTSRPAPREVLFADPRQRQLNAAFANLTEQSKTEGAVIVSSVAADPTRQRSRSADLPSLEPNG